MSQWPPKNDFVENTELSDNETVVNLGLASTSNLV